MVGGAPFVGELPHSTMMQIGYVKGIRWIFQWRSSVPTVVIRSRRITTGTNTPLSNSTNTPVGTISQGYFYVFI